MAGRFSYQIGGAYAPEPGVTVVDRDRTDDAVRGLYSICYVNAFQAQPDALGWWKTHHPDALLRDGKGRIILDTEWNEALLDISTPAKRAEIAAVVGGWMDACAAKGFRGVEADNLDSYTRSHGQLTAGQALAFATDLARRAHADHLALAQKNAADLSSRARAAGFDFAVAEECQVFAECGSYTAVYGAHLIEIEYTDQPTAAFTAACRARGRAVSVVRRDRDVLPAGVAGHQQAWCA